MAATRPESEFKQTPDHLKVARMAISPRTKIMAIRVRALNKDNDILSECLMSPEEGYDYAKAILSAYDQLMGIE